jgi:hypothetical protein
MEELERYHLPYAYEGTFCKERLLPRLAQDDALSSLSPNLVAILYSIHLATAEKKLSFCNADPGASRLSFTVDGKVQGAYFEGNYKVDDYLHPKTAQFALIPGTLRGR